MKISPPIRIKHSYTQTLAEVSYAYTALSEAGERLVTGFTEEYCTAFMQEWEAELNHFLLTGQKRPGESHP